MSTGSYTVTYGL